MSEATEVKAEKQGLDCNSKRDRKVGAKRLLKLAERLKLVDGQKNWAYAVWCSVRPDYQTPEEKKKREAALQKAGKPVCGTRACALGWATAIPAFRDRTKGPGLRIHYSGHEGAVRDKWTEGKPYSRRAESFRVAERTFALTPQEAYHIFGGNVVEFSVGEASKQAVIAAIRKQAHNMLAETAT